MEWGPVLTFRCHVPSWPGARTHVEAHSHRCICSIKVPNVGSRVPVYACFQAPELCREKYLSLGEKYQARPWPAVLSAYIFFKKYITGTRMMG